MPFSQHHPTGVGYAIAQLRRELWFLQLDQYLYENDAQANMSFRKRQCLDIKVYRRIRTAFLEYFRHPDPEYKEVVEKLSKYVYGPDLTPVNCMSPTRALQMLWGYYAGSIPKGPNAEEDGFKSATPIRRLTAELLKAAMKRHFRIKIDKDKETVNAMANANYHMYGLTNCVYHGDTKNVYVASKLEETRSILKFHALKMCVILGPTMRLADYAVANASITDDQLLQRTTVGRAVWAEDHEALGWPTKMKWRHDTNRPAEVGMLPEASLYMVYDRKTACKSNMMVRPFSPYFDAADGLSVIPADQNNVNRRFQIGHSLVERFFGILVNTFPWLLNTRMETDLKFVTDSIEILLMAWNLIKQIEEEEFLFDFTDRQRQYHGESYLAHYYEKESRFSSGDKQKESTSYLLTQLWTYYEPACEPFGPVRMSFSAPMIPARIQFHDKDVPEFLSGPISGAASVAEGEVEAEQSSQQRI